MIVQPIRMVIIEDHLLLAQALASWMGREQDFDLVGCAGDGVEGWQLCVAARPDFALVDIELPKLDGLELSRRLLKAMPSIRILAMSGMVDPYTIWRVRQSGVHGYIEKVQGVLAYIEAIRAVAAGGTFFSETFERVKREWLCQPESFHKVLSEREQAVLQRVVAGWEDQRIADELGISLATVAVHRKHIRRKLELHNDRELVGYAREWGLDGPVPHQPERPAPPADR